MLAQFAAMHDFTLAGDDDATVEAACLAILRPDEVRHA